MAGMMEMSKALDEIGTGSERAKVCPISGPIFDSRFTGGSIATRGRVSECIGTRCAWYDGLEGRCAVLSVARGVTIRHIMEELKENPG